MEDLRQQVIILLVVDILLVAVVLDNIMDLEQKVVKVVPFVARCWGG